MIDNRAVFIGDSLHLTNGKIYTYKTLHLIGMSDLIDVTNDFGNTKLYPKYLFKTIDEVRDKKLNIILGHYD